MYGKLKYILNLAIVGITASAIASSIKTNNVVRADEKPKVVASHNVICDLVQTIAQDTIDLTCLIGKNQDPHTYRPTPGERKAIEEALFIFYGGYELEPQIAELIRGLEKPKIPLYEVVSEPIMTEEGESKPADTDKPELKPDPHVWHNIENTVAIVEQIRSIFLQVNPTLAEQYLVNSVALTEQLWQLDAWIKDRLATVPKSQRVLVTTHDSLNYYAQAYYLEDYLTLQGLNAESAPTASQVKDLSAKIKQTRVPTIFAESTASDRVIKNVARAANVKLSPTQLYADGLGEAENYTEMMSHNTCAIVDGLGGECEPFKAK